MQLTGAERRSNGCTHRAGGSKTYATHHHIDRQASQCSRSHGAAGADAELFESRGAEQIDAPCTIREGHFLSPVIVGPEAVQREQFSHAALFALAHVLL